MEGTSENPLSVQSGSSSDTGRRSEPRSDDFVQGETIGVPCLLSDNSSAPHTVQPVITESMEVDVETELGEGDFPQCRNDSGLNPFAMMKALLSMIDARFIGEYSKYACPSTVDQLYAEKVFDSILEIMDEFVVEEDEALHPAEYSIFYL
jgi:hypothetical protein